MKKIVKQIFDFSNNRTLFINILLSLFCLIGVLVLPSIFGYSFTKVFKNTTLCSLLGSSLFCIILLAIYSKDLGKEFKLFIKNFKKDFKTIVRYYLIGIVMMITFNILLIGILKGTSQNEDLVREVLFSNPVLMLINIVIVAPITEELVFRKSVSTVFKNKWVFAIMSGILFGGAHIMTNVFSGTFILTDLLYILPYGSYGFAFALMDHTTKTTFSSIMVHSFHNLMNGLILINLHFLGVL